MASGIAPVGLVAFAVSLHVGRWHHAHFVPEFTEHAAPVMRAAARFHANNHRLKPGKKLLDLAAPQLLAHNHIAARINCVNLKRVLPKIQTNHANLRHGRSLCAGTNRHFQFGTHDAVGGRPPHHLCADERN
jgi:hypothetical protein